MNELINRGRPLFRCFKTVIFYCLESYFETCRIRNALVFGAELKAIVVKACACTFFIIHFSLAETLNALFSNFFSRYVEIQCTRLFKNNLTDQVEILYTS